MVVADSPKKKSYSLDAALNKVILGDALGVLKKLPGESVDAAFLDPPYFLQLPKKKLKRWNVKTDVGGVDDAWDKFGSFGEYDLFIRSLLHETKRVMKPDATLWIIATYHSIFRIGRIMQDLGYWILNDVIWLKTNPMPNWLGVRFTNATETLIWAVKDKKAKKYTFDKKSAKEFGVGKQEGEEIHVRQEVGQGIRRGQGRRERVGNSRLQRQGEAEGREQRKTPLHAEACGATSKGDLNFDEGGRRRSGPRGRSRDHGICRSSAEA
jgi:DNA modification methylase